MDTSPTPQQPTTAEVLAEVERRRAEARPPTSQSQRRFVILADRFVFWLSKHWLALFNALAFLYVGMPFVAPLLMVLGVKGPALAVHAVYGLMCHQLPYRSWFLFGPQLFYTIPELMERVGADAMPALLTRAFIGNAALGYKVALCQRDTALYGAILLGGLVYGLARRRWQVRPLPFWAYVVFGVVPMLLDGGYQFLSYLVAFVWPAGPLQPHETMPALRLITGALFGLATVWLAYPYVQETMDDLRKTLQQRFGWQ